MPICRSLLILAATAVLATAAETPPAPAPSELTITAGQSVQYRFAFRGTGLTYSASGLPAGMRIDPATGTIQGNPAAAGSSEVAITAANKAGAVQIRLRITVLAAPKAAPAAKTPPPPPPPAASGKEEEEDVADPMLASGAPLSPWTDNQRRVIHHWFLPGAAALDEGDWYYRISHVARVGYDEQPRTNLLGLDDDVRLGLTVGWSPAKATTLTVQRVNGRDLALEPVDGKPVGYDTFDILGQLQLLDQRGTRGLWSGPCDLSLVAGVSWMLRNHGSGDTSLDIGLIAERDFLADRLRLGVGLVHAGLSAYDAAVGSGPGNKLFPDEQDYLASQGAPVAKMPNDTTAVPITLRFALGQHWYLLGEAVIPISGWDTGKGPAYAAGFAIDTNTHEFSFIVTNTANAAFNSVITGAAREKSLPFFAFAISAYF